MGNREWGKAVQFRQSRNDFPLTVRLGEKTPSWGISRWNKSGLRFVPPDDEGFTLRGDRRRLVYKGRQRSHRFTILGDSAFEYDCILEKEPESNVISLTMEGAENFDFFRQPDFVPDPFLKGSYAVYKKETLLGEGTGKLCHIHRPEIIDARGRRCWGDLSVIGNRLCIAIPEKWLGEAKYPVIVDPTVGTTTVGSQTKWSTFDNKGVESSCLYGGLAVNKFLLSEVINGATTAYVYCYDKVSSSCRPILYSENNDAPLTRLSTGEGNFDVVVSGTKPAGWRSTTFSTSLNVQGGSYVWYGLSGGLFYPRFDYGLKMFWYTYDNYKANFPDTYPFYPDNRFYDYKISMYFEYTNAQNYVRTLTQGVTLNDTRKLTCSYTRFAVQTTQANTDTNALKVICLKILEIVQGLDFNTFKIFYIRSLCDSGDTTESIGHLGIFFRELFEKPEVSGEVKHGWVFFSKVTDTVHAVGTVFRGLAMLIRIITGVFIRDYLLSRFLISQQELSLKSCISREIILECRIGNK